MTELGRRLVITHLELENFKSYAGVQRIGPFHKSFSSVVGPNGSGKSNVIDSMLFVFGKRAKQLRLNKVSELIHNSTDFQNLDFARVSVFFQEIIDKEGDNDFDPVPNSSLCVTRVAYRNNSSKYFLDDKTSNFTEVTQLLKGKGIDLDNNRFLILQGEVEQISMMKPKGQGPNDEGLLEYLEDIVGSDCYVERIDASAKQLEELNEKRGGLINRLKITEKEKDGLEGAKLEAEAYIQAEQDMFRWQGTLFQLFLGETSANIAKIEGQKDEMRSKLEHERAKLEERNVGLAEVEKAYKVCSKEHEGIQKELEQTTKEFKEFERKDIKSREDLKHLKEKQKKNEQALKKGVAKRESFVKQQEDLTREIPELETQKEELAGRLEVADKDLEQLQLGLAGEAEQLRVELDTAHATLSPLQANVQDAQSRLEVVTAENQLLKGKQESAKQKLQEAHDSHAATEAEIVEMEGRIGRMDAALEENRSTAVQQREQGTALGQEQEALQQEVRQARAKVEEKRAQLQNEKSKGQLMKALLEAKASGKIPGIHGRLGDLGAVDKKYDVAISTACGPLDFIVVDDTATAQKCLQLLREQKLGVATFLMLDKQQKFLAASQEEVTTPDGVPRLYDLVKVNDERLRVAFFYALQNTLVAKDTKQASHIAYGDSRWARVVSLTGTLIEQSGTLSGGGRPQQGRMCLGDAAPMTGVASMESVTEAEQELQRCSARLEEKRDMAAKAAKAAAAAEKTVRQLEVELPKAQLGMQSGHDRLAEIQRQLSSLEAATSTSKEDEAKMQELEKAIGAETKALTKAQKKAEGPAAKVAEIQERMDNLGGEKLRVAKGLVTQLQEGIEKCAQSAAKKKAQVKTNDKAAERLEKELVDGEKEKEKLKEKIAAMQQEFEAMDAQALVVQETFTKTQELLKEKAGELSALKKEYDAHEEQVQTIRTVEVEITNKLEDLDRDVQDNRDKAKHWDKELADVRSKLQESLQAGELPALLSEEELATVNQEDAHIKVSVLEQQLKDMNPDHGAIAEYKKKEAEYQQRHGEVDGITQERDEVRRTHEELRKKRLDEFMAGFNTISMKLKEMYQMITLGGDAELELVDSLDPFTEGIVFSVRPPKKSWKNISNLSGGEKTLSSLALVFALHHYKPTPLYVMDEIDAALDFKNVSIVAHYIKERTKNAQFVIISLRNNMFELADRLVGIYKTDNTTKSVAINPGSFSVGQTQQAVAA
ncbi:hypothetical protein CYMTET_20742 [Cymbomonas tetramitiformis]|uniref:Structural maintenance of chromosomes protein n=1 Tax=Cymbomonas tetramitiformis TaxID=36881 RepID=A0AAE0G3G0_9CHLO|nr:hypothetical protein CYMTET_20742 [Cymbomonas tetramitiformis]